MSKIFKKMFLIFQIIPFILNKIENCLKEEDSICINCEPGFYLSSNSCNKCEELNCLVCSSGKSSCYSCENNFILQSRRCGIKCTDDNIKGCELCLSDYSECIKCLNNCKWNGEKCTCTERNLMIIFLTLMSLIIIIIFILCLAKPNLMRNVSIFKFALDANEGIMVQQGIIPGVKVEKDENLTGFGKNEEEKFNQYKYNNKIIKTNENDLIDDSTKNKEEKEICDYCLIEKVNIKLKCGCNLCDKHKNLATEKCPVCGKNI